MTKTADTTVISADKLAKARRANRKTRPQLLTRSQLDGRTNSAKLFDSLANNIASDLGGVAHLSTIERSLIEGFSGAYVVLMNLNTKLALGEPIDLGEHAQCVSAMVKIAAKLGLKRQARADVTPSLAQYLANKEHETVDQ
jgi:hypothetical protein